MGLAWVWWCVWGPLVAGVAGALLCGRRGTWRHPLALCVAGVALGDIHLRFFVAGVALVGLAWVWWRLGPLGRA